MDNVVMDKVQLFHHCEILVAKTIAHLAHAGQTVESTGEDFIMHPAGVAALLPTEYQAAGWLHDVLEDTKVTVTQLAQLSLRKETIEIVTIVSRDKSKESYTEFIQRIAASHNIGAIRVKLADLTHNQRPGCPDSLRTRYEAAVPILERALQQLH